MTAVCENYLSLDLAWLRRRKMLTPGRRSSVVWSVGGNRVGEIMIVPLEDALLLVYRARSRGQAWQDHKQMVPFTTTATALGGYRRWFECPQCARPCQVLLGNGRFLCRRCCRCRRRTRRICIDLCRDSSGRSALRPERRHARLRRPGVGATYAVRSCGSRRLGNAAYSGMHSGLSLTPSWTLIGCRSAHLIRRPRPGCQPATRERERKTYRPRPFPAMDSGRNAPALGTQVEADMAADLQR
jgi:hypothetical protein